MKLGLPTIKRSDPVAAPTAPTPIDPARAAIEARQGAIAAERAEIGRELRAIGMRPRLLADQERRHALQEREAELHTELEGIGAQLIEADRPADDDAQGRGARIAALRSAIARLAGQLGSVKHAEVEAAKNLGAAQRNRADMEAKVARYQVELAELGELEGRWALARPWNDRSR